MTAAAAQQKIVNLALGHLGESRVETLDPDETSEAARKLLPFLDEARDLILGKHGWRSAMTYAVLEDNGEGGDWRYRYWGDLDGDCLRVWSVGGYLLGSSWMGEGSFGGVSWEVGTRAKAGEERAILRATAAPLNYAYIRRIGWDGIGAHLRAAMAAWVASMGALAIQGDGQKADRLEKLCERLVMTAAMQEGTQAGGQAPVLAGGFAGMRRSV